MKLERLGLVSAEEYEELSKEGYDLDDTVGKSGIEQAMESELRGKDGTKTISVQNGTVSFFGSDCSGTGWAYSHADGRQHIPKGLAEHSWQLHQKF